MAEMRKSKICAILSRLVLARDPEGSAVLWQQIAVGDNYVYLSGGEGDETSTIVDVSSSIKPRRISTVAPGVQQPAEPYVAVPYPTFAFTRQRREVHRQQLACVFGILCNVVYR